MTSNLTEPIAPRDHAEGYAHLASFEQNVDRIEAWLTAMEAVLAAPNPDGRLLRLKNLDITTVFDEATEQCSLLRGSPQAKRYIGLIPRFQEYIFKSDAAIKKWEAEQARRRSATEDVDINEVQPHHEPMNNPTREEIDAKLELIETRMDGRVAAIERSVQASIEESRETRRDIKSLRWTIIFTAVATVVALWGVNAAIFSNMVASFESGKNTAAAQADVKKQTEETAALIKKMEQQLDAQNAKPR